MASGSLISYAGLLNGQGPVFYAAMGVSVLELLRLVWKTDYDNRDACWKSFVGCGRVGFLISLGLGSDYVISQMMLLGEEEGDSGGVVL